MPMKKYPVEKYKGYTIFVISGIDPTMFTAEKSDPSKGITITDDSLDTVKKKIDETLSLAVNLRINTWDGPVVNQTFQNPKVRIKCGCEHNPNGLAIIVESPYDLDVVITVAECAPLRESKKYKRRRHGRGVICALRRIGQSR